MSNSFTFTASKLWNSLPPQLKKIESVVKFKQGLKHYLRGEPNGG
jgi:hypothetical protein